MTKKGDKDPEKVDKEEPKESPVDKPEATKLKLSDFIANQFLDLHYKELNGELVPCPSADEKAINVKVQRMEKIPEIFIPRFLESNRNFIGHYAERCVIEKGRTVNKKVFLDKFPEKDGLPFLTEEQSKKYGIEFKPTKGKLPDARRKYSAEHLSEKLVEFIKKHGKEKGEDEFKKWAEDTFIKVVGKDIVDRRHSCRRIINGIRKVIS